MTLTAHWSFALDSTRLSIDMLLANPIGQAHAPQLLELIDQFLGDPLLDERHRDAWGQLRERAVEALTEPSCQMERELGHGSL
ncbi:hypothetical protein SD80_011970 [Scytonema tolypothrichoides VB-61278]|nr:hypothetical protein SD80_011970 [Scytonema tolypothrichoides VB-61278]